MGMSVKEFFEANAQAMLSAEEAGAGFAAAVALAEQFRGQVISSTQAIRAASGEASRAPIDTMPQGRPEATGDAYALAQAVHATLYEQSQGWKERSLFERQWVLRDFKKTAGMPVEGWLQALERLESLLEKGNLAAAVSLNLPLEKLAGYYSHLADLAKGFEKDPTKLQENLEHIQRWQAEVEELCKALK